jgi:hypothetical protein
MVNHRELLDATLTLLEKWDIDEKTARLVAELPLLPENYKKLAQKLALRASAMPQSLLIYLLQLRGSQEIDRELWERYLQNASPQGIALILRHWPQGLSLSSAVLRHLLWQEDEACLIPLLSAMKQRSIPCPAWGRERLVLYLSHPNMVVRVWAKALLPEVSNG